MDVKIEETWKDALQEEFNKPYFEILTSFVRKEYQTTTIYPPAKLIFNAFNLCPFDKAKVVIIGQDPYHGPGQAHGLCFSVNDGIAFPPSLINIFKEIEDDLHKPMPASGNLERWASQGVLLLNAILTVRANQAASHQNKGWEEFTDSVIKELSDKRSGLVFMLWGSYAQKKGMVIDTKKHLVLKAVHPSPLSAYRGFFGCKHFSQANAYLQSHGETPIEW
ncbi:MAG: uracil-DNA glycosylase [Paludibacteraceae bacterium]|nr:uracil-DNA glycosylase [Paludibacteraceae bacterium]